MVWITTKYRNCPYSELLPKHLQLSTAIKTQPENRAQVSLPQLSFLPSCWDSSLKSHSSGQEETVSHSRSVSSSILLFRPMIQLAVFIHPLIHSWSLTRLRVDHVPSWQGCFCNFKPVSLVSSECLIRRKGHRGKKEKNNKNPRKAWEMSQLHRHLSMLGVDWQLLWNSIWCQHIMRCAPRLGRVITSLGDLVNSCQSQILNKRSQLQETQDTAVLSTNYPFIANQLNIENIGGGECVCHWTYSNSFDSICTALGIIRHT